MRRAVVTVVALATLLVGGSLAGVVPGSSASRSAAAVPAPPRNDPTDQVDFDGDGFDDLAVGAPGEQVGAAPAAGAVSVLYGSAAGLAGANQTVVQGNPEPDDGFGTAMAKHDFNGDGFTDLAVGAPSETVVSASGAGAVTVLYGGPDGLPSGGGQVLLQASVEDFDFFGGAMDAGFFNGDDFADLAVGAPGENVSGQGGGSGAVNVFYGSAAGLSATSQALTQGRPEGGDNFGAALVAGFFDDDVGPQDLAVGAPGETVGSAVAAGAVSVFYGSPGGLATTSQTLLQGNAEEGDFFGSALASGFADADNDMELAVGAPGETVRGVRAAGAVNVFLGQFPQMDPTAPVLLTQNPFGGGVAEQSDEFGAALAMAPFNGDATWELAVGVPGEDIGGVQDAGIVNVLFNPLTDPAVIDQTISQDTPGVPGGAEAFDRFGSALAQGVAFDNFDGDQFADLAVGAPLEGVGGRPFAGAVNVLDGSASGPTGSGSQLFTQGPGTGGAAEAFDNFGQALD